MEYSDNIIKIKRDLGEYNDYPEEKVKSYDLPTQTRSNLGAMSELRMAADLINKGFYVLRSIIPNCPFDIIAYYNGDMYRIEVKSAREDFNTGNIAYSKPINDEYYILALHIINLDEIRYNPDI